MTKSTLGTVTAPIFHEKIRVRDRVSRATRTVTVRGIPSICHWILLRVRDISAITRMVSPCEALFALRNPRAGNVVVDLRLWIDEHYSLQKQRKRENVDRIFFEKEKYLSRFNRHGLPRRTTTVVYKL